MQAVRNLIRVTPAARAAIQPQRNMSVIAIPPRNKVSTGEMVMLSALMVIGWTAIPIYVLANIKSYRDK